LFCQQILGVIAVSTTFNSGTKVVELGSTDIESGAVELVKATAAPDENFSISSEWLANSAGLYFGPSPQEADAKFVADLVKRDFSGEEGRKRFRQVTIGLVSRDSLHLRLESLVAPVLWIRGSEDHVYVEAVAKDDIAQITNAKVEFKTIQGAYHAPNWTHAKEVNPLILDFVKKNSGVKDARALREAVGMIDM
jgi:pimeloyl-ACP methyl ester carboxylesterase